MSVLVGTQQRICRIDVRNSNMIHRGGGRWCTKKKILKKNKKTCFSGVKLDGDHGLAETFFEIRSGTCRKNEFFDHFFYSLYVIVVFYTSLGKLMDEAVPFSSYLAVIYLERLPRS
jgi:hypothetical protein